MRPHQKLYTEEQYQHAKLWFLGFMKAGADLNDVYRELVGWYSALDDLPTAGVGPGPRPPYGTAHALRHVLNEFLIKANEVPDGVVLRTYDNPPKTIYGRR